MSKLDIRQYNKKDHAKTHRQLQPGLSEIRQKSNEISKA